MRAGASTGGSTPRWPLFAGGLCVLLHAVPVAAQAEEDRSAGLSAWGMPGVGRVGLALPEPTGVSLAADAGYGWTEPQNDDDGAHHRLLGSLAVAVRPLSWLALSLRFDGRYDRHPPDDDGRDDSLVGEPRLRARVSHTIGDVALGLDGSLRLPGADPPSVAFDAASFELAGLAAYRLLEDRLTVGAQLGFRYDRSGQSVDDPDRLRQGDRLALGVTEFNAAVIGAAVSHRIGPVELLGEMAWDVLVGEGSPSAGKSPLRLGVGLRYHAMDTLQLEALFEGLANGRPSTGPGTPLVAIDPRATLTVGLRYRFEPGRAAATETSETEPEPEREPEPKPKPEPEAKPEVPEPAPKPTELRGLVRSFGGRLLDATVRIEPGAIETRTDEEGSFGIELSPGRYQVRIEASGFDPQQRAVEVQENGVTVLNVELRPKPRTGTDP